MQAHDIDTNYFEYVHSELFCSVLYDKKRKDVFDYSNIFMKN